VATYTPYRTSAMMYQRFLRLHISRINVSAEVHMGCSLAKPTAGCVRLQQLLSELQQDAM
jgi:hypothetical protein